MKKSLKNFILVFVVTLLFVTPKQNNAQSQLNCTPCHKTESDSWLLSKHANTQSDVADELAAEWAGLPPDSVILGQDAENCIACHGPIAITANSGMTEVQTMGYFFSISSGVYTSSTQALHTDVWPHNACVTCHDVPANHPKSLPVLSIFSSPDALYKPIANTSILCGQCHGSLRYPGTDHRRLDAWQMSKHGHGGQNDVAGELGGEWSGSTPNDVIAEENCIACHAPSTVMNNTFTEAQALGNYFTTSGGVFTSSTAPKNTTTFSNVSCVTCHNPHSPAQVSYFNSSTKKYEVLSSQKLCGQCHGSLRFPDTDHRSYDIAEGTGGMGVKDKISMTGVQCIDCHMHISDAEGTNASMFGGHSWNPFITEDDASVSASCTACHPAMTASIAMDTVNSWKAKFAEMDSIANIKVSNAEAKLISSTDSFQIKLLKQAEFNLSYAESDESGGVHNHLYTQSLLNDAIKKSDQILSSTNFNLVFIAKQFKLYPNPFNFYTNIAYNLPKSDNVNIEIYNMNGEIVRTFIVNQYQNAGLHSVKFDASDLPVGIYFCKFISGQYEKTVRMILLH